MYPFISDLLSVGKRSLSLQLKRRQVNDDPLGGWEELTLRFIRYLSHRFVLYPEQSAESPFQVQSEDRNEDTGARGFLSLTLRGDCTDTGVLVWAAVLKIKS